MTPGAIGASHCGRLAALVTIVLLALIGGSLAGLAIGRFSTAQPSYRDQRLVQIRGELHRVEGDYLLALGDSHVARWHAREFCGLPLINGGVHGATTRDTADMLSNLDLPRPPRAIILSVGTNDANRKRFREPPEALIRFQQAFRSLLRQLGNRADLVVIATQPRLDARAAPTFSEEVAGDIAATAEATCGQQKPCRLAAGFGNGIALMDGLHLADYERAYREMEPGICAALTADPPRAPSPGQNRGARAP